MERRVRVGDEVAVNVIEGAGAGDRSSVGMGQHVWPSALLLSHWVLGHRGAAELAQPVLELGAGVGLPGMVAALSGAGSVTLTDVGDDVLQQCARTVRLNGLEGVVDVRRLRWGHLGSELAALPAARLVLGADVLYDPLQYDALFASVATLLDRGGPEARFVTAYHERGADEAELGLDYAALKWRLRTRELPPPASARRAPELLSALDSVRLLEFRLA